MTIYSDVRNKLSIIIGPVLEQLCCQRTHMCCENIVLQSSKRFIILEICIVCWLQAALWQPNMNEIYSNLPFSRKDFLHLKCREYFIIGQNMSSFHLCKYLFFKPPCSMNKIIQVYNIELDMLWCNDCLYMLRIVNITSIVSKLSL